MSKSKRSSEMRSALQSFLKSHNLKPHNVAKKAGIASSTLYNFLAGTSASLSADVLQKIADTQKVAVDELLGGTSTQLVKLIYHIGIFGKMFKNEEIALVGRPVGVPHDATLIAAEVKGDGLMPLGNGWRVFFNEKPQEPNSLLGRLCVVRTRGTDQPMIREIRKGSTPGLYSLHLWNATPIDDVEIVAAHHILSITQPPHPEN